MLLSDILNQYQTFIDSSLYKQYLEVSNCTVIEQAPACGAKIALLLQSASDKEGLLFQSLRLTDEEARGQSSYLQTLLLFNRYAKSLDPHGLNMRDHLVRTWIYVADIDVNYEGVVKARNDIFRSYGLTAETHFVASTGIGGYSRTCHATVAIDFLTCPSAHEGDWLYLKAPDHLNPTHEYGVAFERGTRLRLPGLLRYYVSGTASIDRFGDILYPGDVMRQCERLLENIGALLVDGGATIDDVRYFMVYLRDFADCQSVSRYMSERFPLVPKVIVHAKVCRPGWLVEMECVAERQQF